MVEGCGPKRQFAEMVHHDPVRWNEFRRRYFIELKGNPGSWRPISEAASFGNVTLIYSSHDSEHNNAVALKEFLNQCLNPEATG